MKDYQIYRYKTPVPVVTAGVDVSQLIQSDLNKFLSECLVWSFLNVFGKSVGVNVPMMFGKQAVMDSLKPVAIPILIALYEIAIKKMVEKHGHLGFLPKNSLGYLYDAIYIYAASFGEPVFEQLKSYDDKWPEEPDNMMDRKRMAWKSIVLLSSIYNIDSDSVNRDALLFCLDRAYQVAEIHMQETLERAIYTVGGIL